MRRKDREQTREFALNIVDKCAYGVMSMVTPEGMPYGVPLSIVRIDEYLYYHCALEGQKTECLHNNDHVSVCCVGNVTPAKDKFTTYYESALLKGTATEVTDGKEKIEALRAICEKYSPENRAHFDEAIAQSLYRTGIWKIKIEEISGKAKIRE